mgnify:FL=1
MYFYQIPPASKFFPTFKKPQIKPSAAEFENKKTGLKEKLVARMATKKDLSGVSELNRKLFKDQYRFDSAMNLEWTASRDGQKYLKRRISRSDGFVEVVENSKKDLVAYLAGAIVKRPMYRIKANYAELESIIVEPDYRGANLGSKLLSDFITWCRQNKINYISLLVASQNDPAIKFYKKIGFKPYDLTMRLELSRLPKP